jgi:hypothetical protein
MRSPLIERFWEAPTLQIKELWIVSFAPQAVRGWMEEGKFREPAFYGAPRTAIMHNATSERINGSEPHDACWRHAQWARTLRQKL